MIETDCRAGLTRFLFVFLPHFPGNAVLTSAVTAGNTDRVTVNTKVTQKAMTQIWRRGETALNPHPPTFRKGELAHLSEDLQDRGFSLLLLDHLQALGGLRGPLWTTGHLGISFLGGRQRPVGVTVHLAVLHFAAVCVRDAEERRLGEELDSAGSTEPAFVRTHRVI